MEKNYKQEISFFVKNKYKEVSTKINEMESKMSEMVNDGRYNPQYLHRALLDMNKSIKELNQNNRKEILNHLELEHKFLTLEREELLNKSVDPNVRLSNIMMAQLGAYDIAIDRSINIGDIGTATALLGICKGNTDKLDSDTYIELDTRLYDLTKTDDIKHIEYLKGKLGYSDSSNGIITDIDIDLNGNILGYTPYMYNNQVDKYLSQDTSIF